MAGIFLPVMSSQLGGGVVGSVIGGWVVVIAVRSVVVFVVFVRGSGGGAGVRGGTLHKTVTASIQTT